eukprot:255836_1
MSAFQAFTPIQGILLLNLAFIGYLSLVQDNIPSSVSRERENDSHDCHHTFHTVIQQTMNLMEHVAEMLDNTTHNTTAHPEIVHATMTSIIALLDISDGGANYTNILCDPQETIDVTVTFDIIDDKTGEEKLPDINVDVDTGFVSFDTKILIQLNKYNGKIINNHTDIDFGMDMDSKYRLTSCVLNELSEIISGLTPEHVSSKFTSSSDDDHLSQKNNRRLLNDCRNNAFTGSRTGFCDAVY